MRWLEARQHFGDGLAVIGDGVADRVSATSLIAAVMKPISPGPSSSTCASSGEEADSLHIIGRVGAHHADALALLHHAIDNAQ